MSDELQNDDSTIESDEPVVENLDTGSELAPDSDEQHEPIAQVDEEADKKQKATQDVINKKTFEAKQAQRDLQSANDKIKAFEDADLQRREALLAETPEYPNEFDDNFEQKKADYIAAVQAQGAHNSDKAATLANKQQAHQQEVQERQREVDSRKASYHSRAAELGISTDELNAAGSVVVSYGIQEDLAMHLLSDPDGPLIMKHLAANPQEGFELAAMSPYEVGPYLDTVRAKAEGLKPKTSSTPDPADTLQGNGVDPGLGKYPNLKGTVFS